MVFPVIRSLFSPFLTLALFVGATASAGLQKGVVEVGKVEGSALARNAEGKVANLTKGLTFKEGTRVETQAASTVELVFSNGATVVVTPETQIVIKVFTQVASPLIVAGKYRELQTEPSPSIVQIELYRGKIIGEARKLNPSTQFTVKTPVGLTRVRGTVWTDQYYYEDQSQTGTQVSTCVRGEIEVNDLAGSLPVPLIKSQEIEITGPAPKPTPKFLEDDDPVSPEPSPALPTPPVVKPGVADPEKIKDIIEDYKDATVPATETPPPGPTPPGPTPPEGTPPGPTPPEGTPPGPTPPEGTPPEETGPKVPEGDDKPPAPPKVPETPRPPPPPLPPPLPPPVIENELQNRSPSEVRDTLVR